MKIEGTLNMIGYGEWRSGRTKVTSVDIGEESLRNLWVPDYLKNYMRPGDDVTLLVLRMMWQRVLCGVRLPNGKTYATYGPRLFVQFFMLAGGGAVLLALLWAGYAFQHGMRTSGELQTLLIVTILLAFPIMQSTGNVLAYLSFRSNA